MKIIYYGKNDGVQQFQVHCDGKYYECSLSRTPQGLFATMFDVIGHKIVPDADVVLQVARLCVKML